MSRVINNQPTMGIARLGEKELPVVPQKHARLRKHLSPDDFNAIFSKEYSHQSYRLLCILIPAMDPNHKDSRPEWRIYEWEFDGFRTEEAWDRFRAGDKEAYDEDDDPSPTTDEIANAFETALLVNGAGRAGKLVSMVEGVTKVVEVEQEATRELSSTLPTASGESPSTNSGTSPLTSTPSGG